MNRKEYKQMQKEWKQIRLGEMPIKKLVPTSEIIDKIIQEEQKRGTKG